MANTVSNHAKYMIGTAKIDFSADTFKIILMANGFSFNKDTHATYASVSASELATGYGYTRDTKTLGTATLVEDDTNDRLSVTWADVQWTASGGSIGPTPGAIIYDDTSSDNTIIGYIDFAENQTATNGGTFTVPNIEFRLA